MANGSERLDASARGLELNRFKTAKVLDIVPFFVCASELDVEFVASAEHFRSVFILFLPRVSRICLFLECCLPWTLKFSCPYVAHPRPLLENVSSVSPIPTANSDC